MKKKLLVAPVVNSSYYILKIESNKLAWKYIGQIKLFVSPEFCHPTTFRFHLTIDTLVIDYAFYTIRVHYGLSIRLHQCWGSKQRGHIRFGYPLFACFIKPYQIGLIFKYNCVNNET